MVKTTSLVLFSFLAITLLLSTVFARIQYTLTHRRVPSNQQIQTRTAPSHNMMVYRETHLVKVVYAQIMHVMLQLV